MIKKIAIFVKIINKPRSTSDYWNVHNNKTNYKKLSRPHPPPHYFHVLLDVFRLYTYFGTFFKFFLIIKCQLKMAVFYSYGIYYYHHDDVIKWKHFPRYWPFVPGIHRSPVNSPHKGQWRGALMFSLICVWINGWVNSREACDLRRHRTHLTSS